MELIFLLLNSAILNFLKFYTGVLTIRIYLTWFPNINMYQQPFSYLGKMTDGYLRLFRGLLPPLFGFDLSPLLAFLTISTVQEFFVALEKATITFS
jgi:YggT family protein